MNKAELAGRLRQWFDTGCKDKHGNPIHLGDRVRYNLQGSYTKREYWNPEYEVIFDPPMFTLKHVGGGKDGGSHLFILKCGGSNGDLEIIEKGNAAALTEAGPGQAFKPAIVIQEDAGITELVIEDAPYVAEPVLPGVYHWIDKHVAMDDGRLVGMKVWASSPPPVQPVVMALRHCPYDGGYDRELGPVGCLLAIEEKPCVCQVIAAGIQSDFGPRQQAHYEQLIKENKSLKERLLALTAPPSPAPGVTDRQAELKAFSDWAWTKDGEAIGNLSPSAAAREAWLARAALQPAEQPDDLRAEVERLTEELAGLRVVANYNREQAEAAEARVKALEAGLEPFARFANDYLEETSGNTIVAGSRDDFSIELNDCRLARALLDKPGGE